MTDEEVIRLLNDPRFELAVMAIVRRQGVGRRLTNGQAVLIERRVKKEQRTDLGYQGLMTHQEAAKELGIERARISNLVTLGKLERAGRGLVSKRSVETLKRIKNP